MTFLKTNKQTETTDFKIWFVFLAIQLLDKQ